MKKVEDSIHSGEPLRIRSYAGTIAVLATMHGKDRAIAPPFKERLGMTVVVPEGLDTDIFGTFTGDVERPGNMLETARQKAHAGLDATGAEFGIASEGAYGPHADMPFYASGSELIIFIDRKRSIEVAEALETPRTNFASLTVRAGDSLDAFLARVGFPEHALAVTPTRIDAALSGIPAKGIRSRADLDQAIYAIADASADGTALVQSDMRAHCNPTRMHAIGELAGRLASRLQRDCPECRTPGVGLVRREPGLPCSTCTFPTRLARFEVHACPKCDYERQMQRSDGLRAADPAYCDLCNP